MNLPLVIHHDNCADGFAAAWVVWKHFGGNVELHPGKYGEAPPDVTGREVYIVDFSYPSDVIKEMSKTAAHITIIDHHKTAQADLCGVDWVAHGVANPECCAVDVFFDMERSGCALTWIWFNDDRNEPVPQLLLHIEDRDLWKFELEYTREIQSALYSYPFDMKVWDDIITGSIEMFGVGELVAEGRAIQRKHMKDVEAAVKTARTMYIGGFLVPVVNCSPVYASDVGHVIGEGHPFAATYFDNGYERQFSLRSLPEAMGGIDVSAIAKQYGGGGHKHAAGFKVPIHKLVEMDML